MYRSRHVNDIYKHIYRTTTLKKAEKQIKFERENNPDFSDFIHAMSKAPRCGAIYSNMETDTLRDVVIEHVNMSGKKMTARDIAKLAWKCGRSANGLNTKLLQIFGRGYYTYIENPFTEVK